MALIRHIKTILSNCKIENGIPKFNEEISGVIEKYCAEVEKHKSKWMGYSDAIIFLYQQILGYLADKENFLFSGNLEDIEGTKGILSLSEKMIQSLDSIPREYFVFFELASVKGMGVKEIFLTDDIAFVERVNEDDFSEIKVRRALGMGLLRKNDVYSSLKKERIYVRIRTEGYISSIESRAAKKAFSKFKQVILLGQYSNILIDMPSKPGTLAELFGSNLDITSEIIVWNTSEPSYVFNTSRAVSKYISKIGINEDILKPDGHDLFFDNFEDKDNPTPADKVKLFKKRFNNQVKLLNTSDDDKNSEPIKTAIEWAFESLTNDNETFSFIQACIGIEAILGDEETKGDITKTLTDRCAYLIGSNISNRNQIKKNFEKLYDDRSKLVHGRKAYLNKDERGILNYAQYILKRIILKETSNIG